MKTTDSSLEYEPFGRKVFVFGGDFCQVLLIVPKTGRESIMDTCFQ